MFKYNNFHKYIHNIHPVFFNGWQMHDGDNLFENMYSLMNDKFEYNIKDSERYCLLKVLDSFFKNISAYDGTMPTIKQFIGQVFDHLDMVCKIRKHIDIEMRATSFTEFHEEHIELAKIQRTIRKGYSIEYKFHEKLIKHIEYPIIIDEMKFYPVLLRIDAEYTEEGSHMHHCVATYADREQSIIVSLREESRCAHERVTSEFDTNGKYCVQSKYFCNAAPPERFLKPLQILKDRIASYKGSIKSISKEKIPLIINGQTIKLQEDGIEYLEFLGEF